MFLKEIKKRRKMFIGNVLGRQKIAPYICPYVDLHTCKYFKLDYFKAELRLQVELRLLISWLSAREIILNCPSGLKVITRVLKSGKMDRSVSQWFSLRELNLLWLALKMEEVTMSQWMWAASKRWKRQGNGLSYRVSSKNCSLSAPWF